MAENLYMHEEKEETQEGIQKRNGRHVCVYRKQHIAGMHRHRQQSPGRTCMSRQATETAC